MNPILRQFRAAAFDLAALGLFWCSTPKLAPPDPRAADAAAFAAPTKLTATLVDPINIDLRWKDNATGEAGYFVEYSPQANDEFVIIEALPPNAAQYRHPNLLRNTRFVYRVRPFFGLASDVAEFEIGKEGPQQEPAPDMLKEPPPENDAKKSIRTMATQGQAAPTDLTAILIPPAGVLLHWKSHAADADGYLLEIKPPWGSDFKVSAFLPADRNSSTSYNFPFETKFALHVRAFFYGEPSNLAEQTTGADTARERNP